MHREDRDSDSSFTCLTGDARSPHDSGYQQGYVECYQNLHASLARRSLVYLLAGLLLGGVIGVFAGMRGAFGEPQRPLAPDPRTIGGKRGDRYKAAADYAERYTVSIRADVPGGFFGGGGQSSGSGFVFDDQGHIVTNHHVVAGARKFSVIWNERVYGAEYIGYHPQMDVAVLRINAKDVKAADTLEEDESVFLAEEVLAIGSPFGLRHTVTQGIVSHVGRRFDDGTNIPYIQTDCAINRGNSGGPLVNLEGRVVGMNRLIISGTGESAGIGFAIPINIVREVARQIIEKAAATGKPVTQPRPDEGTPVDQAYLGVEVRDTRGLRGTQVTNIVALSPAEKAGMKQGDVIQAIDGAIVRSRNDLISELLRRQPGNEIEMAVLRAGSDGGEPAVLKLKAKLDVRPER